MRFGKLCEFFVLKNSTDEKKIIFLDELPWMDTPRSNFISAFEHFWNCWASARKDIVLIICGSATSWIINKVINDHGKECIYRGYEYTQGGASYNCNYIRSTPKLTLRNRAK